jgi:hypothetical protein
MHPATPADALRRILDKDTAATIAAHPNADADLLETILTNWNGPVEVLFALLGNERMPSALARQAFAALEKQADWQQYGGTVGRRLLRWHPVLNPDGPRLPEGSEEPFRHYLSSLHPGLQGFLRSVGKAYSPTYQPRVAREPEWTRRLALALNVHATPSVLQRLAQDGNRWVRVVAGARLAEPERTILGISYSETRAR